MRFMIVLDAMGGTDARPFGILEMVDRPGLSTAFAR